MKIRSVIIEHGKLGVDIVNEFEGEGYEQVVIKQQDFIHEDQINSVYLTKEELDKIIAELA